MLTTPTVRQNNLPRIPGQVRDGLRQRAAAAKRFLATVHPALLVAAAMVLGPNPTEAGGPIVPELLPLEQAITNYMAGHGFNTGTLALMKDRDQKSTRLNS